MALLVDVLPRDALTSERLLACKCCHGGLDVHDLGKGHFLKGFCCTHVRECDLYRGAASVISVRGNRCLDWSIMGNQEQFAGSFDGVLGFSDVFFFLRKNGSRDRGSHDRGSLGPR